jgi:hypothetical protein
MSLYTILLFVHVSGAIGLFAGMGTWLFGITAIARTGRVEQVRSLADLMAMTRYVVPVSAFVTIASGLAMALSAWGLQTGWILVAIGGLFLIGPTGTWIADPKVRAIATLARTLPDGFLPTALAARTHDLTLYIAIHSLTAMLFGIVFLMTTKPAISTAIGAMVVSLLLGLVTSLPFLRAQHAPSASSKRSVERAS